MASNHRFDVDESPHKRNWKNFKVNEVKFDEGYDSDGQIGPFFDVVICEVELLFDEAKVGSVISGNDNSSNGGSILVTQNRYSHKEGSAKWLRTKLNYKHLKYTCKENNQNFQKTTWYPQIFGIRCIYHYKGKVYNKWEEEWHHFIWIIVLLAGQWVTKTMILSMIMNSDDFFWQLLNE